MMLTWKALHARIERWWIRRQCLRGGHVFTEGRCSRCGQSRHGMPWQELSHSDLMRVRRERAMR